jgi:hypothetical protein
MPYKNKEENLVPTGALVRITDHEDFPTPNNEQIELMESRLLFERQVECPVKELFAPGVYLREIFMPAGTFVIGQEHRTEHFNVVIKGRVSVLCGDKVEHIVGPKTFVSGCGVRKVLYIHEDTIWQTIHPTDERDPAKLREQLIVESDTFQEFQIEEAKIRLKLAISAQNTQEKAPAK